MVSHIEANKGTEISSMGDALELIKEVIPIFDADGHGEGGEVDDADSNRGGAERRSARQLWNAL